MQRKGQLIALACILVVLGAIVVYEWPGSAPAPQAATAPPRPAGKRGAATVSEVPPVRIAALEAARTRRAPGPATRNPFQFEAKAAAPPAGMTPGGKPLPGRGMAPGQPGAPVVPAGPPPPPPIPFKFIGVVQAPDSKLAVLMDTSTRDVFYGREGDIVDGRYRILRIAVESIEMAYLDGRGRQTIRLTGA